MFTALKRKIRRIVQEFKMKKFSKQIKDAVSEKLKDERIKVIDGNTENLIVEALLDGKPWPRKWLSMTFAPGSEFTDTISLLQEIYSNDKWKLECEEPNLIYTSWVKSEDYSVFSFSPARALLLAIWNAWRLEHDSPSE